MCYGREEKTMEMTMGLEAFGAYVKALRTQHKMSQGRLAELVGVAGNTIYRIEAGRQEPQTEQLAALLTILGGRIKDVRELLGAGATAAKASELAQQALTEQSLLAMANTDPKRAALLKRIAAMSDDPVLTARIEAYLDGLEAK
jgi:transcriptional regulator with XRE-family HTH domain